jgi:hypothetical protein
MMTRAMKLPGRLLTLVLVFSVWTACAGEAPVAPGQMLVPATVLAARVDLHPDLGTCGDLEPPAGSTKIYHVYAKGVQIYRWSGSSWTLVGPSAELFADPNFKGQVGTHYAGPTWETLSGSKVVGAVSKRCTADPTAVQWLLLNAVSAEGPGVFGQVKYIQRLNTVGGIAPTSPGSTGQEVSIPYTTEYFFYRAR